MGKTAVIRIIIGVFLVYGSCVRGQALTSYTSSFHDFTYTAPAGWYFNAADTTPVAAGPSAIKIQLALKRRSGTQPYLMVVSSYTFGLGDTNAAKAYVYKTAFSMGQIAAVFQKTLSPAVRTIQDTMIGTVHFVSTEVTTTGSANVAYFRIEGGRVISLLYWVSDTDWEANRNAYYQHFVNANFYQAPTGAKVTALAGKKPEAVFWDLLGRPRQEGAHLAPFFKLP